MADGKLQGQVGKHTPFSCGSQEAFLNLQRTASKLAGPFHALFKEHKLTEASYNTLRILRGHRMQGEKEGVRASKIGCEMVVRVPDVTRIVDRLVAMDLVERCSCDHDRRVVYVRITDAGLALLEELDQPLLELHRELMGHLSEQELGQLNALLEKARAVLEDGSDKE